MLFFEGGGDGTRIQQLRIDERGEFVDEWPGGFFEEGFNELITNNKDATKSPMPEAE